MVVLCGSYLSPKRSSNAFCCWPKYWVDSSKRRNDVENLTLLSNVRSKFLDWVDFCTCRNDVETIVGFEPPTA